MGETVGLLESVHCECIDILKVKSQFSHILKIDAKCDFVNENSSIAPLMRTKCKRLDFCGMNGRVCVLNTFACFSILDESMSAVGCQSSHSCK